MYKTLQGGVCVQHLMDFIKSWYNFTIDCKIFIRRSVMNCLRISKEALSLAMAYVGVLVGAGLSSGQDMLQYR